MIPLPAARLTLIILGLLAMVSTSAVHDAAAQQIPTNLESMIQQRSGSALPDAPPVNAPPTTEGSTDAASLLNGATSPEDERMFGEQLFYGLGEQAYGVGLNDDYVLAIGDRVSLRMWGAFPYEDVQIVDPQGNLFLPNVGPIHVAGVRNDDLNEVVSSAVRDVYRANVDVYVSLEESQPVRVFVTGFVRAPGQYPGVAADSVLGFLLRAGGIDPARGSYIDVRLIRDGALRASFNLYEFLLEGRLEPVQIQDGDTIVVGGRANTVRVTGDVFNDFGFEFEQESILIENVLTLARPRPGATHVSIVHKSGTQQFAEYHALSELDNIFAQSGDEISVVSDRAIRSILVRVDGAVESSRVLTLPYGSRLRDAIALIRPTSEARVEAIQLFRQSVAERQKEMIDVSLRVLESTALTASSTTSEEAALRAREAEQITRFIDRASRVEPRGQVVLAGRETAMDTLLDDGDVLVIPEQSSLVNVHGQVTQPNAIAFDSGSTVRDYIRLAGGTVRKRRDTRILLLRQDGTFVEDYRARPEPGDEILVLPAVRTRHIEITRGISQILFQLAVVAGVAVDL